MGIEGVFHYISISRFIVCLLIFFSSLSFSIRANDDDGMTSFEEMQQQRQMQMQEFDRQESAYRSTHPEASIANQRQQSFDSKKQQEAYKFHYEGNPLSEDQLNKMAEELGTVAEKLDSNVSSHSKSPYFDANNSGYLHQLSRALPCFKEFISLLYQARYARDSELLSCETESCQSKTISTNLQETENITDRFYACLKFDPELEASLVKPQKK